MTINYRLGSHEVEAYQHDGTDSSADTLADWVRGYKKSVRVLHKGEYDYDLDHAYLRLLDDVFDRVVRPNFWIVRIEGTNVFYAIYPDVFQHMYHSLQKGSDE